MNIKREAAKVALAVFLTYSIIIIVAALPKGLALAIIVFLIFVVMRDMVKKLFEIARF